jgi:hypothetical protein
MESRLLTRGPVDTQSHWMEDAAKSLRQIMVTSTRTATAAEIQAKKPEFAPEDVVMVTIA